MLKSAADKANKEFYSPPEIAAKYGYSHQKILNWIRSGELLAFDMSTSRRGRPRWGVRLSDFETFLMVRSLESP